ncbi:MAG: acyl-homoserine-lactone synthase [Salinarimonas sp.]
MITLFTGEDAAAHAALHDQMLRGRAAVFRDKLGWDVSVVQGRERDAYDDANPLYIVSCDPVDGRVAGSIRLMPTTGPTLMRDVFADVFEEDVDLVSATIWEATRFCVHPDAPRRLSPKRMHLATCELAIAMCEIGLAAGLTQYIGVFEERMERVYARIGWKPDVLARSNRFSTGAIAVGLWDVGLDALAEMRDRSGIDAPLTQAATISGHGLLHAA